MSATVSINRRRARDGHDHHGYLGDDRVIGIDVGMSTISAGVVDPRTGTVIARCREATPSGDGEVLRTCAALAGRLASQHPVWCIGLAVPATVDQHGVEQRPATWDWRSTDVQLAFADIAPTQVHSDVQAAAFGEAQAGAARGLDCFVYVTVGSRISAVVVRHGRPWGEQGGVAPVVRVPTAEVVPSRTGLTVALARRLGEEIGRVVDLIEPDAVVVGGAVGLDPRARRQWVDVMRQCEWQRPASFVPVIEAQFKTDAELVGAALASDSLVAA